MNAITQPGAAPAVAPATSAPMFAVTFFKNYAATEKAESMHSASSLVSRIRTVTAARKEALPWLKLARFGETRTDANCLRNDENVLAISGVEADYDGGKMGFAEAVERLEKQGLHAIVYTSPSHTEDAPRWRVLCPTSTELPADRRAALLGRLNGLCGGIFSVESWTLSQSYYYGSVNHNPSHAVAVIDGTPIDLHDDLDAIWQGKPTGGTTPNKTGGGDRKAEPIDAPALLADMMSGDNYHAAAVRLAGRFARNGVAYMQARDLLRAAMEEVPEDKRDQRWQSRYADLDRCLQHIYGAQAKSGGPVIMPAATPPDRKRPLFRPLPPPPAFPIEALAGLRGAAEAIQARTQAPTAICAQAVLAAATLAVQAHRDVMLPAGRRPLTGLFASIAESGERKTSVDRLALAPVYTVEEEWRERREDEMRRYTNDLEAFKAAREDVKKRCKGDRATIRAALDALGAEPKPPPQAMLLVEDFSPEALVLHLRDSRPWAGVFTSEGGVLIGGHAFNEDKAMATGALLNKLWDGEPIRRARVLTGSAFLPGRRCSAHVMMQRVVAERLLGDAMLDGIGMMARLLIVEPESTVGTRMFRDAPPHCATALRAYTARLHTLLTKPPVTKSDGRDVLDPPAMTLTDDAQIMWIAFHDAVEHELRDGRELRPVRSFGAKMAEHAGRLAAVLAVYDDPDAMTVPAEAMAAGIELAKHYGTELLRLHGGAAIAPDLHLAARLLAWWQARSEPRCHLAAIYQGGPGALRDAATARRIVGILEEHGWIERLLPATVLDDAPRRDAWRLIE